MRQALLAFASFAMLFTVLAMPVLLDQPGQQSHQLLVMPQDAPALAGHAIADAPPAYALAEAPQAGTLRAETLDLKLAVVGVEASSSAELAPLDREVREPLPDGLSGPVQVRIDEPLLVEGRVMREPGPPEAQSPRRQQGRLVTRDRSGSTAPLPADDSAFRDVVIGRSSEAERRHLHL